jgi:hypothetical protein
LKGDDQSRCVGMNGGTVCNKVINEGVQAGELERLALMR